MSTDNTDYKKLYEEKLQIEENTRKWQEEQRQERNFARWFYIIFFGWLAIGLFACEGDSGYGPGCYDADPTQYVDVYCEDLE